MKTQIKQRLEDISTASSKKENLFLILKFLGVFGGGVLSSTPYILGSFSPFCAVLPSCFNGIFSIFCALGATLGIFVFQSGISAFRNFAIVITSTVLSQIFLNYFDVSRKSLIRLLCPTFCALSVNSVFLFSQRLTFEIFISTLFETALIPLCVPIFTDSVSTLKRKINFNLMKEKEFISFSVFINFLIGQALFWGEVGKSICTTIFILEILFFYRKNNPLFCMITGCISGVVFAFSGDVDFMCAVFPLSSALLCVLKSDNKYIYSLIPITACFLGSVFGEYTNIFPVGLSGILGSLIFVFMPSKLLQKSDSGDVITEPNPIAIPLQAKEISTAVNNLGECINAVRNTLRPMTELSLKDTVFSSVQRVCEKCDIKDSCINSIREKKNDIYSSIEIALNENNFSVSIFPENFTEACYKNDEIFSAIKQGFFLYNSQKNSQNKIRKFQEITGNQFKSFGSILDGLCSTAINGGAVTSQHSVECERCAEEFSLKLKSARLCTNKAGQEYYTLSFLKPDENFNVTLLTQRLCKQIGAKLSFPTLVQKDDVYSLIFKKKEQLSFEISAATRSANPNSVSGDYYRSFCDSFSRQNIILSDGMGTGSRAAIDSAFTCETLCNLLKAGLDVKTAISAVNCAMLIKSTDESLSTVDLLIADPILSKIQIFKCGAAPTFVLRQGKAGVIEPESTPIGILQQVDMTKSEISISAGDIILTVSDGVCADNWNWIINELRSRKYDNPTHLAKHILQCALDRKNSRHQDDMTVIAIIAQKA